MSTNTDSLKLDILKFFKQSLIKYIHIDKHQGFTKHFILNPAYQAEQVKQVIAELIQEGDLEQHGELLSLSTQGSDKSCEGLTKKP